MRHVASTDEGSGSRGTRVVGGSLLHQLKVQLTWCMMRSTKWHGIPPWWPKNPKIVGPPRDVKPRARLPEIEQLQCYVVQVSRPQKQAIASNGPRSDTTTPCLQKRCKERTRLPKMGEKGSNAHCNSKHSKQKQKSYHRTRQKRKKMHPREQQEFKAEQIKAKLLS